MSGSFSKFRKGYVKIRLQSADPERFFRICVHRGIPIWSLQNHKDFYEMELFAEDFPALSIPRRKTGSRIHLIKKQGLPFFLNRNKKRKAFFLGIFLAFFLLFVSSLYIWDIQIHGNHHYSRETLLEVLQEAQVQNGTRKNQIDCKKTASFLRASFPDIVWVSARIEGTCLILELKENEDSYRETTDTERTKGLLPGSSLLAPADGIITKLVTRSGMPLAHEGQTCKKGDALITGQVEIPDENGETARYEAVIPDGDVSILSSIPYSYQFDLKHTVKTYEEIKTYPMLKISGKELILGLLPSTEKKVEKDSGKICGWEIQKTEHPVYLTSTFCLPFSYGRVTLKKYRLSTATFTKEEAKLRSEQHLVTYMKQLVNQGMKIENKNISIEFDSGHCFSKGILYVYFP